MCDYRSFAFILSADNRCLSVESLSSAARLGTASKTSYRQNQLIYAACGCSDVRTCSVPYGWSSWRARPKSGNYLLRVFMVLHTVDYLHALVYSSLPVRPILYAQSPEWEHSNCRVPQIAERFSSKEICQTNAVWIYLWLVCALSATDFTNFNRWTIGRVFFCWCDWGISDEVLPL